MSDAKPDAKAADKATAKPVADNDAVAVRVSARGVETRFQGGVPFGREPREIMVDRRMLAMLRADPYLQVEMVG